MTGPEHYQAAERLLDMTSQVPDWDAAHMVAGAQVHATLALAAATGLARYNETGLPQEDRLAWLNVASERKS